VIPYLQRRHSEAESDSTRDAIEGYMRLVPCATCDGARLNPLALAVTVDELNINELCSMSILEATERLVELHLDDPA
jgi:excinuclease ABC subunit A